MAARNKDTPIPEKITAAKEEAAALATFRTDLEWVNRIVKEVKKKVDEGHIICMAEPRIEALEKGRIFSRGLAVTALFFVLGTAVTGFVACERRTEQDAETRVLVQTNAENLLKLEKSVTHINDARAEDARQILQAVKQNGHSRDTKSEWCGGLSRMQKRRLKQSLGTDYPCES